MSKETLHQLRLYFPGLVLFIVLILLIKGDQNLLEIKISTDTIIYLAFVFGVGILFYAFNPRYHIMKKPLSEIDKNIKDKLIAPFADDADIKSSILKLRDGQKLVNVFYHLIDSDESLKARASEVYLNGFIWSSLADVAIITPLSGIVFIIAFLITKNVRFAWFSGMSIILLIMALVLIPVIVKRHFRLSNNQLTYITEIHKKELREQLISLL